MGSLIEFEGFLSDVFEYLEKIQDAIYENDVSVRSFSLFESDINQLLKDYGADIRGINKEFDHYLYTLEEYLDVIVKQVQIAYPKREISLDDISAVIDDIAEKTNNIHDKFEIFQGNSWE